jgi:hypothetical protein
MAKKVEKERDALKKKLRGQLKAVAATSNKHYETVRAVLNKYVETGFWRSEAVRDAVKTQLVTMKEQEEQRIEQEKKAEAEMLEMMK